MRPLEFIENDRASQTPVSNEQVPQNEIELLKSIMSTLTKALEALEHSSRSEELAPGTNFYDEVARFEIKLIERALKQAGGNQAKAARLLGLNQTTLHGKIKHYGIHPVDVKYESEHEVEENASRRAAAATYSAFHNEKAD